MQELWQHVGHVAAERDILLAQLMHLDGAGPHLSLRPHHRAVGRAGADARSTDPHRRDADDVVDPRVEAGRFAVERYDLGALLVLATATAGLGGEGGAGG